MRGKGGGWNIQRRVRSPQQVPVEEPVMNSHGGGVSRHTPLGIDCSSRLAHHKKTNGKAKLDVTKQGCFYLKREDVEWDEGTRGVNRVETGLSPCVSSHLIGCPIRGTHLVYHTQMSHHQQA